MKLAHNIFTRAIKNGDKQIGLWVTLADGLAAEVVAGAGYDWVVIDTEHSPGDGLDTAAQLQAFAGTTTTALVRPAWNDAVLIKRILDLGAQGLVIPMIQSVEQAKNAIAATRYPPHGFRGVAGGSRATNFGRITDYFQRADQEITVILQLETVAAIACAEQIADLDGVDGIFFGPADIAADMGHLGNPMHPDVWALIKPMAAKLQAKGMPCGTLVLDTHFAADLMNSGFTFVAVGTDATAFARAVDGLLMQVKDGLS
jgi:4-hydroxy-2-oxoheptanedioate aldolase